MSWASSNPIYLSVEKIKHRNIIWLCEASTKAMSIIDRIVSFSDIEREGFGLRRGYGLHRLGGQKKVPTHKEYYQMMTHSAYVPDAMIEVKPVKSEVKKVVKKPDIKTAEVKTPTKAPTKPKTVRVNKKMSAPISRRVGDATNAQGAGLMSGLWDFAKKAGSELWKAAKPELGKLARAGLDLALREGLLYFGFGDLSDNEIKTLRDRKHLPNLIERIKTNPKIVEELAKHHKNPLKVMKILAREAKKKA